MSLRKVVFVAVALGYVFGTGLASADRGDDVKKNNKLAQSAVVFGPGEWQKKLPLVVDKWSGEIRGPEGFSISVFVTLDSLDGPYYVKSLMISKYGGGLSPGSDTAFKNGGSYTFPTMYPFQIRATKAGQIAELAMFPPWVFRYGDSELNMPFSDDGSLDAIQIPKGFNCQLKSATPLRVKFMDGSEQKVSGAIDLSRGRIFRIFGGVSGQSVNAVLKPMVVFGSDELARAKKSAEITKEVPLKAGIPNGYCEIPAGYYEIVLKSGSALKVRKWLSNDFEQKQSARASGTIAAPLLLELQSDHDDTALITIRPAPNKKK